MSCILCICFGWLFFIRLLSLWKALHITTNRRCIYLCRLQGCQLPIQPGKPNAGSALPVLPPTRLAGSAILATKPKLFLILQHSHVSASFWHISCQVARRLPQPGPVQDTLGEVAVGREVSACSGALQAASRGRAPAEHWGQGRWPHTQLGEHFSHVDSSAAAEPRQELGTPHFPPPTPSRRSACLCEAVGAVFKHGLQSRNHKHGEWGLSASLPTENFEHGKKPEL